MLAGFAIPNFLEKTRSNDLLNYNRRLPSGHRQKFIDQRAKCPHIFQRTDPEIRENFPKPDSKARKMHSPDLTHPKAQPTEPKTIFTVQRPNFFHKKDDRCRQIRQTPKLETLNRQASALNSQIFGQKTLEGLKKNCGKSKRHFNHFKHFKYTNSFLHHQKKNLTSKITLQTPFPPYTYPYPYPYTPYTILPVFPYHLTFSPKKKLLAQAFNSALLSFKGPI